MLIIVGANNAQGASFCQGNFDKPPCETDPGFEPPPRRRLKAQGTGHKEKNERKLAFSLRLAPYTLRLVPYLKLRFSAHFSSIFSLKIKKSDFLYLKFFI